LSFNGYLLGMALSGLGFGMYVAVDLALVADVLPDEHEAAKDLGVLNFAGALPFTVARDRAGDPGRRRRQLRRPVRRGGGLRDRRSRRDRAGQGRPLRHIGWLT